MIKTNKTQFKYSIYLLEFLSPFRIFSSSTFRGRVSYYLPYGYTSTSVGDGAFLHRKKDANYLILLGFPAGAERSATRDTKEAAFSLLEAWTLSSWHCYASNSLV